MKINCQAFLENKKIISIKDINAQIENYEYDLNKKEINGIIKMITNCYIENMDEISNLVDNVPFNVLILDGKINNILLTLDNFVYNLVEGRGIELEFDIDLVEQEPVIEIPIEFEKSETNDEEKERNSENNDDVCEEKKEENELIKDQVIDEIEQQLEEKLEKVDDNFLVDDSNILSGLDRSYTRIQIFFNKNNEMK